MSGYFDYWAKTGSADDDASFHLLPFHSLDVAAVGAALLDADGRLLPRLERISGLSAGALRTVLPFLLGLHDLGKFAEAFQGQKPKLMALLQGIERAASSDIRHDSLGYLLWREWARSKVDPREAALLEDLHALSLPGERLDRHDLADVMQPWMAAVLGHHGRPPEERPFGLPGDIFRLRPGGPVSRSRVDAAAFARDLKSLLGPGPLVAREGDYESLLASMRRSSWWLAGFVILCDWLGSSVQFFPHESRTTPLDEYWRHARRAAATAVTASGLVGSARRSFRAISDLLPEPVASRPTPLQRAAADLELSRGPQLFILEDLTGSGKTEAALILAHRLIAAGFADGLYFALPTMATADAMAPRVEPLVRRILDGSPSFLLSHSGPRLTESDRLALCGDGGDSSREDDTPSATAAAAAWLGDSRKKALLADVGVGTIDQALLAVLQSRHAALRLFGLHRRVLVVDEVHACDAYMLGVLSALLHAHAAMGGSAILLSATLPREQRRRLAEEFSRGRGDTAPALPASEEYPLLSHVGGPVPVELPVAPREHSPRTLPIAWLGSAEAALDRVERAARAGKCACWIRNSVKDALEGYRDLSTRLPEGAVILFHARFALGDRLRIEQDVVERFGAGDDQARRGRVVVATQVVEQSLDVDFDVMITDLCPVDLVIQRAGRLQRHAARHPNREPPVLEVLAPKWSDDPPAGWLGGPFRRTAMVYGDPGVLWRTMRVLREAGALVLPRDARRLVEEVYGDDGAPLPQTLLARSDAALGKELADDSVARGAVLKLDLGYQRTGADWSSDVRTPTRLGEPTTTVRLARLGAQGRPEPWESSLERHRWALSQVAVARRLVSGPSPDDEALRLEAERSQPFVGEDVVTVILRPAGEGAWAGRAVAEVGRRNATRTVPVRLDYSPKQGLSVTYQEA